MNNIEIGLALLLMLPAGLVRAQSDGTTLNSMVFAAAGTDGTPKSWRGVTKKEQSKTNYFLPTGFTFPARLVNAVFSYNVESPAIAMVDRDVDYLGQVVIPAQTQIIGTVSVQQDHDRILVTFHTIVFPKGDEIKFTGLGLSLDGSLGIPGEVETHKDSEVANTVLRSLVTGTQDAVSMSGVNPITSQAMEGLSNEAAGTLDHQRERITTSISVPADTALKIYLPRRIEY
ncbi:MAG: hypothetical protein KGI84_09420 [Elusimicrobia bacterium]|nr:hypothetical protein [Elusimicrobiota bacterium]